MEWKLVCGCYLALIFMVSCEETCPKNDCDWIAPDLPSIMVKGTNGELGNAIFSYLVLLIIKVSFTISREAFIYA